jgi:ATP-dependent RNA helicase DeaD
VKTFEELGIGPELVEALAAEGIEHPTPLQEEAIPTLAKANNLVLEAGPGSGLLVAWAAPLLQRLEPSDAGPRVLVLCATTEVADRLAESLARLAVVTAHSVAALGASWVLPDRAHMLFATPGALLERLAGDHLSAEAVETVVVDQAQLIDGVSGLDEVERVLDYVPEGTQRILSALPMTPRVSDFVGRLLKRTMTLPAPSSGGPERGRVRFRIVPEPREAGALAVVDELLADGARHALVFCRSEDRAADVGDYLTLHGFTAGAPGDESVPVWLGVDALEARAAAKGVDGVVVVSCDAPADPDALDRRHSISPDGVVLVLPREVANLKAVGRGTGYDTVPFPPPPPREHGAVGQIRAMIERAMESEDISPYLLALEPLFERHDPAEVAAAAVALLRRGGADAGAAAKGSARPAAESAAARATATPAWAKLFLGVGERDGLRAGDLVGAITGEAGVPGEAVGRIDIKESHTLVEVHDSVARQVIQAINGTTIKGRSVRADFDRPRRTAKRPRR